MLSLSLSVRERKRETEREVLSFYNVANESLERGLDERRREEGRTGPGH